MTPNSNRNRGLRLPLGESILVPLAIESPPTGRRYPEEEREVLAVLDTGYTGFVLVPGDVFEALDLGQLEPVRGVGRTADGREIELMGNYAVVEVPDIGLRAEGLVETAPDVEEILLGTEWLGNVILVVEVCPGSGAVMLEGCP